MALVETWFRSDVDVVAVVLAFATAWATAALAGWPARSLAWWLGAVDHPGGRRMHARPTARLGGVAVLAGLVCGAALPLGVVPVSGAYPERLALLPVILVGAGLVCALGAIDDVRGIRPTGKLAGLLAIGLLVAMLGVRIDVIAVPFVGRLELGSLAIPAALLWIAACANAMNLIDGVDGAGSGVSAVSAAALTAVAIGTGDAVTAVLFAAVGGATSGFLLHNRQPARIFLGDSGSLQLGFVLAATSALGCSKGATALLLVAAALALAVPLLDSTQSFVRRFRNALRGAEGKRRVVRAVAATAVADHNHIHHRLLRKGLSHRETARVLCVTTALCGVTALLLLPSERSTAVAVVGAMSAAAVVLLRLAGIRDAAPIDARPEPTVVLPASDAPRRPGHGVEVASTREPAGVV